MNVFIQTLNVNKVCQVWVNSRNLGFTQTWENNTKSPCAKQKRNMTPLFWVDLIFEWHEDDMVFRSLLLLLFLERTVRKNTWLRTASVTVMIMFFESGILKVTWSQLCSKSLLNKYEAHLQQHFERYPTVPYFTDVDQHAC